MAIAHAIDFLKLMCTGTGIWVRKNTLAGKATSEKMSPRLKQGAQTRYT